jgi:cytochrome c biogenesis protein CcmG, thiol:disulfide interchange protein DsbE
MEERRQGLAVGAWLLTALLVLPAWYQASAAEPAEAALVKRLELVGYRPGVKPPRFSGPTLDARELSLTDLGGKVILVNFWASWCAECRPEMPILETLHRELASRGLVVVGINAREDRHTVARYAAELQLTFPLILDPGGRTNALYGVVGLPTTFVVGRDGRAVAFGVGPRDWGGTTARRLLDLLLAEPTSRAP